MGKSQNSSPSLSILWKGTEVIINLRKTLYFYGCTNLIDKVPNFHKEISNRKILFDCDFGVLEDIVIGNENYSRIKIKSQFKEEAQDELDILLSLQGAPLIPKVFGVQNEADDLWILFERLSFKSRKPLSDIDFVNMLLDSVKTLRLLESRVVAFRPMRPQTCLFNENLGPLS